MKHLVLFAILSLTHAVFSAEAGVHDSTYSDEYKVACDECTLLNPISSDHCEICETSLAELKASCKIFSRSHDGTCNRKSKRVFFNEGFRTHTRRDCAPIKRGC